LVPRKPADIVRQTAEEMKLPEATVDKVVGFFWQEVRKTLVEMKAPIVQVPNLGRFEIRGYLLGYSAQNCRKYLEKTEPTTFMRATIRKEIEDRLLKIENMKALYEFERERKKQFKLNKHGKDTDGSIPQPQEDL
jgi:hypothetical protein